MFDLSSIRKTTTSAPLVLLYGTSGVGKTTFASQAPAPVFIQTEQGEGRLTLDAFPLVESFDDVLTALANLIEQDHAFKTLVVDSLDHLENHIHAATCKDNGQKENIEAFGFGKGYVLASEKWRTLTRALTTLRSRRDMTIVLIAHAHIRRHQDPTSEAYDRYEPKLHKLASAWMQESCDIVGFARHVVKIQKDASAFGSRARAVGTGTRELCLSEAPAYLAKNRHGLPESVDLDWSAFSHALTTSTQE